MNQSFSTSHCWSWPDLPHGSATQLPTQGTCTSLLTSVPSCSHHILPYCFATQCMNLESVEQMEFLSVSTAIHNIPEPFSFQKLFEILFPALVNIYFFLPLTLSLNLACYMKTDLRNCEHLGLWLPSQLLQDFHGTVDLCHKPKAEQTPNPLRDKYSRLKTCEHECKDKYK